MSLPPAAEPWTASPVTPRRVLVVDDNPGATQVLSMLLCKLWGHTVETAHDGPAALRIAAVQQPEVVLLDIGLPGLDGYEVARAMRAAPVTAEALIVALTGYARDGDRLRSQQAGIDEHLVKPVAAADLQKLFTHRRLTG